METSLFDSKFVDLFKANGPFFFCLFLAGLWLWTIKKAIEIYGKPRSESALRTALLSFSAVFLVGSLVVGWRAIDWWVDYQDTPFGRYATVLGVPSDITIWADSAELYQQRKEVTHSPNYSVRLAFLLKRQCAEKDDLVVQLNRQGMTKPDVFTLSCELLNDNWQAGSNFQFDVDEKTGTLVLRHRTKTTSPGFFGTAHAGSPSGVPSMAKRTYAPYETAGAANAAARVLQSDRATPGEKLDALGGLAASPDAMKNLASEGLNQGLEEPIYATLFALQRHSDRQLSIKARLFLKEAPVIRDIAHLSAATTGSSRKALSRILDSMSVQDLEKVTAEVRMIGAPTDALSTALAQRSAKPRTAPIPTYTKDGDRFYVQANWNNRDDNTVRCVGKAYADLWGGNLKDQTELARAKADRVVYWKKDWAAEMYSRLEACGAQASYVIWEQAPLPPPFKIK